MAKRYSVAEARQHFTELLRSAERGRAFEITRRGEPVAVLVSARKYARLTGKGPRFGEALKDFRARVRNEDLLSDKALKGLRDSSPGRRVDV